MEVPDEVHHVQRILSSMQKTLECMICLDLFDEPSQTKCGHTFCTACLHQLTKKPAPCPLCKERLTRRSFSADHQAAALATAVLRLVGAVQEDCGFNVSPSKFRPRPSIEAVETGPAARSTPAPPAAAAGTSGGGGDQQRARTGAKKPLAKNVRTAGTSARRRRSPPRHVYSRAAAVAAEEELDLLSASQVIEFDGERVGEALAPPPPPLPPPAERRVSGRTRVHQWLGGAQEIGFGISEVESPSVARLDQIRETDGGRLERKLQEEKRRLGVAPLDGGDGEDDDKENRVDVSVTEGTVGGKDARKIVAESVDDAESTRDGDAPPPPAASGTASKRFFKARASSAEGTPSGDAQTQTQTEGTQETSGEDPYQFISSQRTPPKKKKKQRASKKTKPSAAKKLTVTKKAPPSSSAAGEDGGGPVPVDFDDLEPEAAANRRRAPPRRARQAAIRAAEFLALPGDVTLSQESGADSDFEPPASKKTRRVASAVKAAPPPPPPAPVTLKLALARAELGSASQEVRALQELFDDAAPAETGTMTPRGGGTETMTRAEALRKSAAGEQEEAVTPKSVTFSEDVTVKEIPRARRGDVEDSPEGPVDAEELRGVVHGDRGDGDPGTGRPTRTSATGNARQQQADTATTERRVSKTQASKPQAPEHRTSDGAKADANTTTSFAVTDGDDNDVPASQCSLSAPELAAAGLPPPAAVRSPGWSRLPKLKNSFGLKTELAVSGGRRTPTKDEPRRGDTTIVPAAAVDGDGNAPDEPPPSPTSRIDDEATASSGDEAESEGFTASQGERTGRRVSQYKRAVKELEQEVLAMETEMVAVEEEGAGEVPPPVPETEAVLEEDGPPIVVDDVIEMDAEGGEVEEEVEEDDEPPPLLTPQESSNARSRSSRSSNTSAIAASFPAITRNSKRPPSGGRGNTTPQSESLLPAGEERCDSELLASESTVPNSEVDSVEAPAAAVRTPASAQASVPAKASAERRGRSSGGNAAAILSGSRSNIPASVEKPSKVSSRSSDASAMTASTSVVANSRPGVVLPAAASASLAASPPASLPTPDSEDFQVDVGGGATGQRHHRSSGTGRAGRLSRASPRRSPAHAAAAASSGAGKPAPPPPASPGPRRTGAAGPGRRRVVRARRGAPSRRLLVRLLAGQRRLTELVGRLTEQLGRLRGSPAAAGVDGRSPAARSGRLSSAVTPPRTCTRGTAVTPQQTSTRGTSVSSATPAFSPSERPGARRSTAYAHAAATDAATAAANADVDAATNANAADADANGGIREVGAPSTKVTEVKEQGGVPRSPRASTGGRRSENQMKSPTRASSRSRGQAGGQAASQAAVEAVIGSPRAVGSPRSTRRSQAAAVAAAGSASPRTLRTRSSGSSFVPPTVSSSIPGGPAVELAGLPQRRSARRSLAGLAEGAVTSASSSSVVAATADDDDVAVAHDVAADDVAANGGDDGRTSPAAEEAEAEEAEPEAGTEFVSPSPSSPSARGELSALMLRSPVPAPESGPPPESLVADSEEIPPMSITQFERVAKDMEAEAAPPPPRDLCDLDTEEVDCLLEGAPAVAPDAVGMEEEKEMKKRDEEVEKEEEKRPAAEAQRRSGSVGSHKRASSPLGSDVSGKRRRSGPTTPASVTKGTRDDPEVVSDDDEDLLSDGDVRPASRSSVKNKTRSLNASRRQTLLDDDKPVEDVDEPMEDQAEADADIDVEVAEACSDGRASVGAEKPTEIRGTPAAGSGSTTDSPVCRAPASARRRAARISDDEEGEQEDEFGSDADDREEMRRLAAMPVDEFIREIQGEVGAPPAAESTRRISVCDDDEVEETGRKDGEADKSITDSMMQEVDLPAGDDSICEIPPDSSLAVREDESIVGGEGKQSRRSAGRSLNDIDPDLAESADPAPPGSQDSMADIIVSSGEVNSPGRVAGLDTVLVTPGGRRRPVAGGHSVPSAASAGSALNSPRTRRSGRVMTAVAMADGGAGGDTPTSTRVSGGGGATRGSVGAAGSLRGSPIKNRTPPSAERSAQSSSESRGAAKSTGRVSSSSSRPKPDLPPELPSAPSASAAAASAPESDLIPESPAAVAVVMGTSLRRSSVAPPPPPPAAAAAATSPSSEDLLVPANFFNESSLCVPAGEASALEAAAANVSIRKETTPVAAGVPAASRRSVLPSAASGASDTPAPSGPAAAVAAAGTATGTAAGKADAGGAGDAGGTGDGGDVSETESEDMFGASRPIGGTAAAPARKASPPPPPRPPPVLVASGLKRTEQESAQRLAAAHGGRFLRQWQEGVTHVIVRVGPRLEAGRTLKFLQGVAARAWLVSPAWVEDSLAAGRILPEDTYEAIDGATGEPGPRRARLSGGELFAGFVFCCVGPFRDVTMDQLESLIGQSGGAVASSPAALSSAPGRVRLIVAQEECDHDFAGWRRRHGLPSVSYEWLIDCVATQRLWSLLDNTLCGASEQELRAAGVPPELCLAETQDTEYFDSMGL